jgi:hypothetical protein
MVCFPLTGAFLVWFTREDLDRHWSYWVFFGTFQIIWTWAVLRTQAGVADPSKNYVEVREDSVRVMLFGFLDKTIPFGEIEAVEARPRGAGHSIFALVSLPRGTHVVFRLRRPMWYVPTSGLLRSRNLPIEVEEVDSLTRAVGENQKRKGLSDS